MATAHSTNHRASLLNGLRTGGVRSTSMTGPHTAAPDGSFNFPRFASTSLHHPSVFPEEDDLDQVGDLFSQNLYIRNNSGSINNVDFSASTPSTHPLTAALDAPNNKFVQQQAAGKRGLNPNSVPFSPAYPHGVQKQVTPAEAQLHAYQQMQLMQMEIMRLQNAQLQRNQQVQAVVLAEALRQQGIRGITGMTPATAGPVNTTFDIRGSSPSSRRPSQAELLKSQLGISDASSHEDQVPMTAALGGRFGARMSASSVAFPTTADLPPRGNSPPKQTALASGGISLANTQPQSQNNANVPKDNTPSKSDVATSWRRGSTTNSVLSGLRTVSVASPTVKITPPPGERLSPPLSATPTSKLRPRPLSFTSVAPRNIPIVVTEASGGEHDDAVSSASSTSQSDPTTPHSSSSLDAPLSPREEATKKLYEGLGMGRPAPLVQPPALALPQRFVSQPLRHPRGPPSGADELGPKNFATRIRRKAIGGLGVLMDARERRESIEAY